MVIDDKFSKRSSECVQGRAESRSADSLGEWVVSYFLRAVVSRPSLVGFREKSCRQGPSCLISVMPLIPVQCWSLGSLKSGNTSPHIFFYGSY
jgi:hypothetical protein